MSGKDEPHKPIGQPDMRVTAAEKSLIETAAQGYADFWAEPLTPPDPLAVMRAEALRVTVKAAQLEAASRAVSRFNKARSSTATRASVVARNEKTNARNRRIHDAAAEGMEPKDIARNVDICGGRILSPSQINRILAKPRP